ncbi:hypothetical protein M0R45_029963 [Rubus argutus]|uniref:DUF7138 domain-containing protein n=1 Tax=Rubus argutus TaxID=59490 RepID=A0AAW1WBV2_RUBAR
MLSHKIGISPNQFSVFISSPESRRRIPVTSKINFSLLCRETNCFFLVVLKRSKRERRRRNQYHVDELQNNECYNTASSLYNPNQIKENPLENAVFLRRGTGINHGLAMPFAGRIEAAAAAEVASVVCEACSRAEEMGMDVGFHWCAYDPVVTFGFRSPAGPISRPTR